MQLQEMPVSISVRKRSEWTDAEVANVELKLASAHQGVRSAPDVVGVSSI